MQSVSPILTSYHIRNTAQFYKEKMGFTITSSMPEMGYLIVSRDSVELHFSLHKSGSPATTMTQCYIRVNNIDVLYAEYEAAGVVHPNASLNTSRGVCMNSPRWMAMETHCASARFPTIKTALYGCARRTTASQAGYGHSAYANKQV